MGARKGCPNSITPESEELTELLGVVIVGSLDGDAGKKDGGELRLPDGEGNVAGGRTVFWICGDILPLVMGGTLTVGCPIFPLLIGVGGNGAVKEDGCVLTPGGSCEGLYMTGGRLPGGCCGVERIPGGCGV